MIYCKFTVESAYERILISVNIWQSYRKETCLTHCVRLGTFVLKDETRQISRVWQETDVVNSCYIDFVLA